MAKKDKGRISPHFSRLAPVGEEAEETLHAIVLGEADALVIETDKGPRVYTLKDANEPYRRLVEHMADAALIVEDDGTILYCNGRLPRMLGRASVISLDFLDLVSPEDRARTKRAFAEGAEADTSIEAKLVAGDNSGVAVRASITPMEFAGRRCVAVVIVALEDIEALKASEARWRASEERLELAMSAGRLAAWDLDLLSEEVVWNRWHLEMMGYAPNEVTPSLRAWWQRIHPEDRDRAIEAFERAKNERCEYSCEYRVVRPDGTIRHADARGQFHYDLQGRAIRSYGVVMDVTERKQAELGLQEANRQKDSFLATLAHELRNPLAPIHNAVHVLQKKHGAGDPDAPLFGMIRRQTEHLTRLVDDLLEISRISCGKIELRKEPIDMSAIARDALESCRSLIEKKAHKASLKIPGAPLGVYGDPVRLAQVIVNLVNNAVKYTPAGGVIEIETAREGDEIVCRVRDNGVGLRPDARVFDLFAQIEGSEHMSEGGLGIGLALVRKLVEMHGGRVDAQSAGPGHGSEFIVRLPEDDGPSIPQSAAETDPEGVETLRALVIDDNHDVGESLGMLLETLGTVVRVTYDGPSGVAASVEFEPDLVFVDIGMPVVDGYETARRIREQARGRQFLLVALSGWGQDEDRLRAREAGFDLHLTKPASVDDIENLLRRAGDPKFRQASAATPRE